MSLWGPQTELAAKLRVSNHDFPLAVIHALAAFKAEAAAVNAHLGVLTLTDDVVAHIVSACNDVAAGLHDAEFIVDVFQTGSGTASNMNLNEVVAALANLVSETAASDVVNPNDHVNASQSSNDAMPTAVHLAAGILVHGRLLPMAEQLAQELRRLENDHRDTVKIGRTHLMDAAPVTLGQEFGAMARVVELGAERVDYAMDAVFELAVGGTATGTGLNAPQGFATAVVEALARRTGLPWRVASNHFEAQGWKDGLVALSAACRGIAVSLTKVANDIRWMASGPVGGLAEITVPTVHKGSSIMAGKVNPVIPEIVAQVCAQIIGNDLTVAYAGASGSFELNTMLPVIADNTLESITILSNAMDLLRSECLEGLRADAKILATRVERSAMLATALVPRLGYQIVEQLVGDAAAQGVGIRELAVRRGLISASDAQSLLGPLEMTRVRGA